jgi:UPF0148 protein
MQNPDEIMAEYLLKGAKMLSRACPVCDSPLFEYKGETFCVVCRERGETGAQAAVPESGAGEERVLSYAGGDVAEALACTVIALCERVRTERRPEDCLILMECVERGISGLARLSGN